MAQVYCVKCRKPLPPDLLNQPGVNKCRNCGTGNRTWAFPALVRPPEGPPKGAGFKIEDDAACFNHPNKRAVAPCAWCGRFLCSLCDIGFDNQHVCPTCLERGKREHTVERLETQRILYDNMALGLEIWPLPLIFTAFITIVSAPTALFIVFRYLKAPSSLLPRTKIRFYIAGAIAVLQIVGWIAYFFYAL